MRRGANLAISQWFTDSMDATRWARAACVDRQDLPWTHDTTPPVASVTAMRAVCEQCPVIAQCADYAFRQHRGGFYAGVWIPWQAPVESEMTRLMRTRARRHLRIILGVRMGRPPKHG